MKKWFMLVWFPLLCVLLIRPEASATPLTSQTLISDGTKYTATFILQDKDLSGAYDFMDYRISAKIGNDGKPLINFGSVPPYTSGDFSPPVIMPIGPDSLIQFYIIYPWLGPIVRIVDLVINADNTVSNEPPIDNAVLKRTVDSSGLLMTGTYDCMGDSGCVVLSLLPTSYTCELTQGATEECTDDQAPIQPVSVPAPNSLMLLWIGLMALMAQLRRTRLTGILHKFRSSKRDR